MNPHIAARKMLSDIRWRSTTKKLLLVKYGNKVKLDAKIYGYDRNLNVCLYISKDTIEE